MLITSYGIDCALSQILYYHHTNKTDFATISNKMVNKYLLKNKPQYLIGLRPDVENIDESIILVDNTKKGYGMYHGILENFIYDTKISKTGLFAKYMKVNNHITRFSTLADSIITGNYSESNNMFMDFYNAVGHDSFVYRFLVNMDMILNKNEQQLALRYRKFQNELADQYIQDFMYKEDNIVVCRASYNMKDAIENSIIEKYREDLMLIATWDYEMDGSVRINLCSKSDLAGKIAEKNNGDNYVRNGCYKVIVDNCVEDLCEYIMEQIIDSYKIIVEEEHNKRYLEKQNEIRQNSLDSLL